jgi:hypothetical protein
MIPSNQILSSLDHTKLPPSRTCELDSPNFLTGGCKAAWCTASTSSL